MAKRAVTRTSKARSAAPEKSGKSVQKDVDYTIPGLIAIVATVLITGLFFAQPNIAQQASNLDAHVSNTGGLAGDTPTTAIPTDALAPKKCAAQNICDGSRLIRQQADCTQFIAYCTKGCSYDTKGSAVCN